MNMFTSHNTFLSILTGAVAGALITFGLVSLNNSATPVQAQVGQTTSTPTAAVSTTTSTPTAAVSPTPFNPGPEVEGGEVGEGISREGGFFINDLASKLNVPVGTLETAITSSLSDTNVQAVKDGVLDQSTANLLASHETNLFASSGGFFFDIDEFPPGTVGIPVTGGFLAPTSTPTEEVTATPNDAQKDKTETQVASREEEEGESAAVQNAENDENHEVTATATPKPTHESESSRTPVPTTATPKPTRTPRPTSTQRSETTNTPRPTRESRPTSTPRSESKATPTLMPNQQEDFSLFYLQ
jgi:hypothetical protein